MADSFYFFPKVQIGNATRAGGWKTISVWHLDHLEYGSIGVSLAANPAIWGGKIATRVKKLYDAFYEIKRNEQQARAIADALVSSMKGGSNESISLHGIEVMPLFLTYQHWHNEEVPRCNFQGIHTTCSMEWVKIPEPNTHELLVAYRTTGSDTGQDAPTPQNNSAGRHVDWINNVGDRITSHREMQEGSYLQSGDGRWKAVMQGDGNLVIYGPDGPIWASNTDGQGSYPFKLAIQSDGNLVVYGTDRATWASNTNGVGIGPYTLVMQNDANLVLYDDSRPGTAIWDSGTCCR